MWGSHRFTLCICLVIDFILGQAEAFSSSSTKTLYKGKLTGTDEDLKDDGVDEQSGGALHRDGINIWTGKNFQMKRNVYTQFFKCTEEITLTWAGEKEGRTFKAKCPTSSTIRNAYHMNSVMLIGNADDTFCLFTSKNEEYYFKDKGKWTKVELTNAGLKEEEIETPAEVGKLTNRIKSWDDAIKNHVKTIVELQKRKTTEGIKHRETMYKLHIAKQEVKIKADNELSEIDTQEFKINSKEAELYRKIDRGLKVKGWDDEIKAWHEERLKVTAEKMEGVKKQVAEVTAKYKEKEDELNKQAQQELERHEKEEKTITDELTEEQKKFKDKINEMLSNGN